VELRGESYGVVGFEAEGGREIVVATNEHDIALIQPELHGILQLVRSMSLEVPYLLILITDIPLLDSIFLDHFVIKRVFADAANEAALDLVPGAKAILLGGDVVASLAISAISGITPSFFLLFA